MEKETLQTTADGVRKISSRKNFLHSIDIDRLKIETGLSIDEIARISELKNSKGVYAWKREGEKSGTRPSYNALIRLMCHGASVETLFGVEYSPKSPVKVATTGADLETLVRKVLSDLGYPAPSSLGSLVPDDTSKGP